MLFSLKAAKTVSKQLPLLLTHTNIILHNSAEPDPTVHILLLAVGSVRVITPPGDISSCNVGLKKHDPALLFTRTLLAPPSIHSCPSHLTVLTIMHQKIAFAASSHSSLNHDNDSFCLCIHIRIYDLLMIF